MEIDKIRTAIALDFISSLLSKENQCLIVTDEECLNCPYRLLCTLILDLEDEIIY